MNPGQINLLLWQMGLVALSSGGHPLEVVAILTLIPAYHLFSSYFSNSSAQALILVFIVCTSLTLCSEWIVYIVLCVAVVGALIREKRNEPLVCRWQNVLSVYRGSMMFFTCICILAVDFNVFPRRFAKCEEFGFSLMDVGVGGFVFSSSFSLSNTKHSSWRVFVLGIIRMVVLSYLNYPQHPSEYGLAVLSLFVFLIHLIERNSLEFLHHSRSVASSI